MKLIVGLGNPDRKHQKNRHNLGFMVLKKIAQKRRIVFRLEPTYQSHIADMGDLEHRVKLVEPQTYMNESGRAVIKIKNFYKIDSEDIWVIYDDVDLEFGKVRLCLGGSSAGHKGVQSIVENIGDQFWRVRIGISKDDKIPTDKWVLQDFTKEESKKLPQIIDSVANLLLKSLSRGLKEETIKIDK